LCRCMLNPEVALFRENATSYEVSGKRVMPEYLTTQARAV